MESEIFERTTYKNGKKGNLGNLKVYLYTIRIYLLKIPYCLLINNTEKQKYLL